jgi:hypothetical protein
VDDPNDATHVVLLHFDQASLGQTRHKLEQVVPQVVSAGVILQTQFVEHDIEPAVLCDQLPHPCANRIHAEVGAQTQMQDHGFAIEIAEHRVFTERERVLEGDWAHSCVLVLSRRDRVILYRGRGVTLGATLLRSGSIGPVLEPRSGGIVLALWHKFASLDRSRRRLVLEVALLMALVKAGLRVFPYPTLRVALDYYVRLRTVPHEDAEADVIEQVGWATRVVATRLPRATCLVQALTAATILRRRGYACELRIGVRASGTRTVPFEAHAWVDCSGLVAIGAIEDLPEFKVMAGPRSA